jgi:hypothetical protein
VIDQGGRIVFTHDSMSPEGHITETLKVIERLHARPAQPASTTAPRPARSTPP